MKPILYKDKLVFPPIQPENQLTDVLEITNPNFKFIKSKIEYVAENIKRLVKINDTKIYYPEISGNSVFYQLTPSLSSPQYYYPIQYAKIEFKLK